MSTRVKTCQFLSLKRYTMMEQGHTHIWSSLSLEDKDLRVLTQMLKITCGDQSVCLCEQQWDAYCWIFWYWSSVTSAHVKVISKHDVFSSNFQCRIWSKSRKEINLKLTHCLEKLERNVFIKHNRRKQIDWTSNLMIFPLSGLRWLTRNQQSHSGTVESSFCLFCSSSNLFVSFCIF